MCQRKLRAALASVVVVLAVVAPSAHAADRSLYWSEIAVSARLDEQGTLHVAERQSFVFTGDWNGGERTFNVRRGQRLQMEGIYRVDESGNEIPLGSGTLGAVNYWDWAGEHAVRWRSRMPSDPLFENTPLTYVLHYTLSNILIHEDERWILDHDFAFPDRSGIVQKLTVDLDLDRVWTPLEAQRLHWEAQQLEPGNGLVVKVPLRYSGTGSPDARPPVERNVRVALMGLVLVPLLVLAYALIREIRRGRMSPVTLEGVDAEWFDRTILRERAEVVGATWDDSVDQNEVSALIARLVAEGKMDTATTKGGDVTFHLRSSEGLEGYEKKLVEALFFSGATTTQSALRKHYKDEGFSPTSMISSELQAMARSRIPGGKSRRPSLLSLLSFVIAVAALIRYATTEDRPGTSITVFVAGCILCLVCAIAPILWRTHLESPFRNALRAMIPAALTATGVIVWIVLGVGETLISSPPAALVVAVAAFAIWIFVTAALSLTSRVTTQGFEFLRDLARGRLFLRERVLAQQEIPDRWYPYIFAFRLDRDIQDLSVESRRPKEPRYINSSPIGSDSGSSSGSSSSSFASGGGRFGGAGATATWASAISGISSGVTPPSSSSSGGGGGSSSSSSGGSSGGGGGGGW